VKGEGSFGRYRLAELPALLRTKVGRSQLWSGLQFRLWPVYSRAAACYRHTRLRNVRVVAVVGSLGKTTTARAISVALGQKIDPLGEFNYQSCIAMAMLRCTPRDPHAVIEVGLRGKNEMPRFARLVHPDITVVTSIASEHNRSLGTLETTRDEKAHMVRVLPPSGIAFLNGDDPNVLWMSSQTKAQIVTFGFGFCLGNAVEYGYSLRDSGVRCSVGL
jgi:UDP-N-acetylmuramyl pentapeptide synthase